MNRLYIPSTAPLASYADKDSIRMVWSVSVHKPQGAPAYAVAIEGAEGPRSFLTAHPGSRSSARAPITGPATLKKKKAALRAVLEELVTHEVIALDTYRDACATVDAALVIDA